MRRRRPVGRRGQGQDRRPPRRATRTSSCASRAATTPATRSSSAARRPSLHLSRRASCTRQDAACIGNGVVVDPAVLVEEIDALARARLPRRDDRAADRQRAGARHHAVPPGDRRWRASALRGERQDRHHRARHRPGATRTRSRAAASACGDLLDASALREQLERDLREKNADLAASRRAAARRRRRSVDGVPRARASALRAVRRRHRRSCLHASDRAQGERILFEGAQGTLLDVDHGTYPFVTSSNTRRRAARAAARASGPPRIDDASSASPRPTRRASAAAVPDRARRRVGERLREIGDEFGATTGRPRRCGWLDAVVAALRRAVNGLDGLALTKLDVLTGLDPLRDRVAYELDGKRFDACAADARRSSTPRSRSTRSCPAGRSTLSTRAHARRPAGERAPLRGAARGACTATPSPWSRSAPARGNHQPRLSGFRTRLSPVGFLQITDLSPAPTAAVERPWH